MIMFYRWPLDPQTINAMYSFNENEMGKSIPINTNPFINSFRKR